MNRFVHDQVPQHEIRGEHEAPIEGEVSLGRAVTPFRALAHHIDASGVFSKPRGHRLKLNSDRLTRLLPQPCLQASSEGREASPSVTNDYPVARDPYRIGACTILLPFHLNSRGRSPEENRPRHLVLRPANRLKAVDPAKLVKNPWSPFQQERFHFRDRTTVGPNHIHSARPDPDSEAVSRPRQHHVVLHAAPAELDRLPLRDSHAVSRLRQPSQAR